MVAQTTTAPSRPPVMRDRVRLSSMDPNFLLIALTLVVLFASISIIGALRRIRDACEEAVALLRTQADKDEG